MTVSSFFLLFFSLSFPCDSGLSDDNVKELYNDSYQVFTGFLTNTYKSATTYSTGEQLMAEFEVSEIQKGPRRQKILTYISEADSLATGYEYLVFLRKNKAGMATGLPIAIYKVCHHCENREIKAVYSIVRERPFRRIKPPLPKYNFDSGCGCQ